MDRLDDRPRCGSTWPIAWAARLRFDQGSGGIGAHGAFSADADEAPPSQKPGGGARAWRAGLCRPQKGFDPTALLRLPRGGRASMSASVVIGSPGRTRCAGRERVLKDSYPALMAGAYDEALNSPEPCRGSRRPTRRSCAPGPTTRPRPVGAGRVRRLVGSSGPGPAPRSRDSATSGISPPCPPGSGAASAARSTPGARAAAHAAGRGTFDATPSLNGEAFYAALGFRRIGPMTVPMGADVGFP